MNPVVMPSTGVTAYANLEQKPGWTKQSGPAITGPGAVTPSIWDILQVTPPPVQPPTTLTLQTTGVKGQWADWMAKAPTIAIPKDWTGNFLLRASYTFDSVVGIQAFEVGRRLTNAQQITDNGQMQMVPGSGGLMQVDIVPSAAGGWKDTGIRFPTFVANQLYQEEIYYQSTPAGVLSIQYVMLNGNLQPIPASCQNIAGSKQNPAWGASEAVPAYQCDANPTAIPFNPVVALSCYAW